MLTCLLNTTPKWNHMKTNISTWECKGNIPFELLLWYSNFNQKCLVSNKHNIIHQYFQMNLATKCSIFLDQDLRKMLFVKRGTSGVSRKRCSEDMQQIYRRTPLPKCDHNKVPLQLYWIQTSTWVFSCKFAAYFQNTFS